jgi:hypothetical protein
MPLSCAKTVPPIGGTYSSYFPVKSDDEQAVEIALGIKATALILSLLRDATGEEFLEPVQTEVAAINRSSAHST